jgi:exopolysaccharide production protein ExoQ
MPPRIASLVFTIAIAGFLWLDRDRKDRTSLWIWLAVAWVFFGASRGPTLWLYGQTPDDLTQYVDGSPIDRFMFSGLQLAATLILISRGKKVWALLRGNVPLVIFFVYCALSIFWSDFPFVALKRWVKTVGNLSMVWLLLTDDAPVVAVKRFFARTGVLLIPLSVLFIKYYPDLGRSYSRWTWIPSFIGVSTDKNGLGVLTLVFGLGALWNFVEALREENPSVRLQRAAAHGSLTVMALWLFHMANSSTSLGCFLLGGAVLVTLSVVRIERPAAVHALVASAVVFGVIGYLFLDFGTYAIQALGRDSSLTGRTELWAALMRFRLNPWIGTGFESFWLGDRAQFFWDMYWWHPNEAHNGYLEMYLDLGFIGVGFVFMLIITGYRNVMASYQDEPGLGRFRLAVLLIAPIYSITEAAFKLVNPIWVSFLFATTALPLVLTSGRVRVASPSPVPADGERTPAPQGRTAPLTPWKMPPPAGRRQVSTQVGR